MGEQVANNKEKHSRVTLHQKEGGEWYVVTQPLSSLGLIREEYYPVGNTLVYPTKWGRKRGAEILITHLIEEDKKVIKSYQSHLEGISVLYEEIKGWSDDK